MTRADPAAKRPDRRFRLSAAGVTVSLCALLWPSAGDAAGTARTSLRVGATVVETCQVSTRPDRAGAVTLSCSHAVPATVAVERAGPASTSLEAGAPTLSRSADPDLPAGVLRVTVTY